MKKVILSYTISGHINRKFIVSYGEDRPAKIGKWQFSKYEGYYENFHPYTGKNNSCFLDNWMR